MHTFSIGESIRFGWETFKKRSWFLIGSTAVFFLISAAIETVAGSFGEEFPGALVGSVASFLANTILGMGIAAFYLKAHDSLDAVKLGDLWHPSPFWKYLGVQILLAAVVVAGLILLIVPGIIFALMFMFAPYIVIDKNLGPIDAMKESMRVTKGRKLELFGFALISIGIALLGVLALIVGLLVAIPVLSLAFVRAYRALQGSAGTPVPPAPLA